MGRRVSNDIIVHKAQRIKSLSNWPLGHGAMKSISYGAMNQKIKTARPNSVIRTGQFTILFLARYIKLRLYTWLPGIFRNLQQVTHISCQHKEIVAEAVQVFNNKGLHK